MCGTHKCIAFSPSPVALTMRRFSKTQLAGSVMIMAGVVTAAVPPHVLASLAGQVRALATCQPGGCILL